MAQSFLLGITNLTILNFLLVYISVVDVVTVLPDSADPRNYWKVLKNRLKKEVNETVTKCHGLKLQAVDGKMRLTDVVDTHEGTQT